MLGAGASLLVVGALLAPTPPQDSRKAEGAVSYPFDLYVKDVIWGHLLEGSFSEVGGVFYEPAANELYVADMKNALIGIYDPDGVPQFAFGGTSIFADPQRIHVMPDGTIYVLDVDASGIKAFNYRGEPLGSVYFPTPPDAPLLNRIGTFTRGYDGSWYVSDVEHPRVLVYDDELNLRFVLPRPDDVGELDLVTGLAVSKDGQIAVLDYRGTPVQIFDRNGRFLSGFGRRDIGLENFTAPQAAAFDDLGYLYVVDMLRHDVKIFDTQGNFQAVFGGWFSPESRGRGPGEMLYPVGIAIAPDGFVYVSERFGNRVQLFERRLKEGAADPGAERGAEGRDE